MFIGSAISSANCSKRTANSSRWVFCILSPAEERDLFADSIDLQACKPKILATVKPLGGENVKKVEEWTAKTEEKLAAALKVAQG